MSGRTTSGGDTTASRRRTRRVEERLAWARVAVLQVEKERDEVNWVACGCSREESVAATVGAKGDVGARRRVEERKKRTRMDTTLAMIM